MKVAPLAVVVVGVMIAAGSAAANQWISVYVALVGLLVWGAVALGLTLRTPKVQHVVPLQELLSEEPPVSANAEVEVAPTAEAVHVAAQSEVGTPLKRGRRKGPGEASVAVRRKRTATKQDAHG